ncbi:plasmid recombination protein, partial [Hymenobacter defluvii]
EKTPHIHAVVVPITKDSRLSADTLFNPKTLKQLQTDYAEAMGVHGLDRGTIGSRRQHEEMKQVYGRQTATAAELGPLVQPAQAQAFTLEVPPLIGRDTWRADQEAKINAEIARQVSALNSRLQEVGKIAVAQAGAVERAEVLEKQLRTAEGLKQGNFEAK